ncbi:DUF397 domain-containing protein [Streptomyces phyllanthi]|uniref:DUF397 domain-containing protein n=1 Tax=Streptomyces phyllanthi TaxID=1803180 RepID=A0A5N8W352_9ACTN|nr:DUF397 domain-containing protein [Streptomyces phyllanthi]MPY41923.1 DUF397 domain-containing protein [Streptomyces phyllanthi]
MTTPDSWQKSSFSGGGEGNNCLELASTPTTLHLRESDTPSIQLTTVPAPLAHLLNGIKAGRLGTETPSA